MAYKINSFNYQHIRNSIFKNGVATTSKAYGIDKTTLRTVKDNETFEGYRDFIAKKSREQYERRIKRQRERMFSNGLHFDGNIKLNKTEKKPEESVDTPPFESNAELGRAKTIVTEVQEHEQPKDLFVENNEPIARTVEVLPEVRGRRGTLPQFDENKLNIALEMARNGELKGDIAKRLGYYHASNLTYHISKRPEWADAFNRALADGKELYRKNLGKRIGGDSKRMERMRADSNAVRAAVKAERPTVDKSLTFTRNKPAAEGELTAYEKGLLTGAKKMGMTLEEYKQWRKDKLAEAQKRRWAGYKIKDKSIKKEAYKDLVKEAYKDLVKRQNEENKNAENSQDSEKQMEQRREGSKMEFNESITKEVVTDTVNNRSREGTGSGSEAVNTDQPTDTQMGMGIADDVREKFDTRDIPTSPRFAENAYRETRNYDGCTAEYLQSKEEEAKVGGGRDTEAAQKACTCEGTRGSAFADGVNSLLSSIGQAIKIIAIGVLVLLFALAAAMLINTYNSSKIKIDPSTCEYTSVWGTESVKCSTI